MAILDPPHDEWVSAQFIFDELPRIIEDGFILCFCRVFDIPDLIQVAKWEGLQFFDSFIWHDPQPCFVHCSRALKTHEHILVFKNGDPRLPNLKVGSKPKNSKPTHKGKSSLGKWTAENRIYTPPEKMQLTSVLKFPRPLNGPLGRWQKPKDLIELFILAYTNEGETILDPFGGSGTTAEVALENRRNAILIELNPEYIKLAEKRIAGVQPKLFV
jgi:DNA modification methylase